MKSSIKIIVARPRGFCAGVERAIRSVEKALEQYGAPVYVLNHIVHNAHVVNELREKGAIFVHDLAQVPQGAHLLFSAHGVGPERWEEAQTLHLEVIDATCPLVEKVHHEARRFAAQDYDIILIGEPGHDETMGTKGWAPDHIQLIQKETDVSALVVRDPEKVAYITQTTLSQDDCRRIVHALRQRFPNIVGPPKADICYATSNRQAAVSALTPEADLVLVVGDPESANSTRLRDVARACGKLAHLIPDEGAIQEEWLREVGTIMITSGASVPEKLVQGVIARLNTFRPCTVEERVFAEENTHFRLPKPIED